MKRPKCMSYTLQRIIERISKLKIITNRHSKLRNYAKIVKIINRKCKIFRFRLGKVENEATYHCFIN